jgi:hypothetical protein
MGAITGLNYVALETVLRIMGVKDHADCFHRIRIMEAEALDLIKKQEKQNGSTQV